MLFEENSLLPGECSSIIRKASLELEDMYECVSTEEEMIDSHLSRFVLTEDKDGQQILKSQFTKRGHMLRIVKVLIKKQLKYHLIITLI